MYNVQCTLYTVQFTMHTMNMQEPPERPSRAAGRGWDDKCLCNQCWGDLCCHAGDLLFHKHVFILGWSEFTLFWKLQKARALSGPRHSADFITSDGIVIGWISFPKNGQTFLTESRGCFGSTIGRSEKRKSWNFQKVQADSEQRHSTDFRTIDGIIIGWISSC